MLKKQSVFLIFVLTFFLTYCDVKDDEVFVATHEWQVVDKGQKIPKGLHVRINLETGLTEAKLLDSEDKTKALTAVAQETDQNESPGSSRGSGAKSPCTNTAFSTQKSLILFEILCLQKQCDKLIPKSVLEESVKNIKEETINPNQIRKVKDKFRTYDDIKKSLHELNLTPKMDAEIIEELIQKHKELNHEEDVDELLVLLEDLDFMVHQYDNALEFIKLNGLQAIIYKNINTSTSPPIKKQTLKLMGSLMQNNLQPKIHAIETGTINVLLRLINSDSDKEVRSGALGSLGSLLRAFPAAQKQFINSGGLTVLASIFKTDGIKNQIKLVTLISDLIVEHNQGVHDEKTRRFYDNFDLTRRVLEHDWCQNLNKLLLGLIITDKDDHSFLEKCLVAMHTLRADCGGVFERDLLLTLQQHYQTLSDSDDASDTFFSSLRRLCEEILHYGKDTTAKTEL